MGNQWGLGLHFVFVTIFFVATTNTCLGAKNITVACFEHELLALLKFKQSVAYYHDMLSSWVGNDCCRWERVTCNGVTGNVESLHLRGEYSEYLASKELCTSLGELRYLKYLDLSGNNFQGIQIPEFIGSLKQLTYLNLSGAGFSGIIPHHVGNLSNLKNLDLSWQGLVADDMTWISGLPSLEYLDLSYANLNGAKIVDMVLYMIPSLKEVRLSRCSLSNANLGPLYNSSTALSNIKHLDLSYNSFNGQLPHIFQNMTSLQFLDLSSFDFSPTWNFANFLSMFPSLLELHLRLCNLKETYLSHTPYNVTTLSNIRHLDLSYNELTGSIPTFPEKLTKLFLSGNHLNGMIPESLGKLSLLRVLDLSSNELMGPIPTFPDKLTELYLSSNNLNGSIPEYLGKLRILQVLDLSRNKLTGPIPTFSDKLTELYLFSNYLTGSIPVSFGQLSKLRSLDVSHNSLEGVVFESHFANLSMLEELHVGYNSKLTFNVSREWLPPFQLIEIDLNSCNIGNRFPQWLRNQRKLNSLVLSNATISGPLPVWLRKMPFIPFIDLSHNNLTGPLSNLPIKGTYYGHYVRALLLQNNLFTESIPRSLCKRTDLEYLNLSKNRLTGKIPNCLKKLQNLLAMMLTSNGLSGAIPNFIWNISSLHSLNLNGNNFSGELPREIWNLSEFGILDLGDNALSGRIPEWIGENIKSLQIFRIHKNNFTGRLPRSLCKNVGLQILDVAHNNLTGTIPNCLGELQGMVSNLYNYPAYLRFSIGEGLVQVMKGIPLEYTSTLEYVINMDLSSNKFVGEIPKELTALSALVGLNLSNNHLSGGIPDNIGDMKALNSLDFSGNELSGPIPPSITALNFLSYLNFSNNNLSGQIPTGNQLQTLIDPSIYAGNEDLCGAPLPKNCSNHEGPIAEPKNKHEAVDEPITVWFYVDIICGFTTGFWGVIIVLVLKKRWTH